MQSSSSDKARVLIVGAGPAGISLALWLFELEVDFLWLEAANECGGTLRRVWNPISTLPGGVFANGAEMIEALKKTCEDGQGRRAPLPPPIYGARVAHLQPTTKGWTVRYEICGAEHRATVTHAVLATGTTLRLLNVAGIGVLEGPGIEHSTSKVAPRYVGRETLVIGGGDAAFEGALNLADAGSRVTLFHRSSTLRAQPRFIEGVMNHPGISISLSTELARVDRNSDNSFKVQVRGMSKTLTFDAIFPRIGVQAALPQGVPQECLRSDGYADCDLHGRSPIRGLWFIGDNRSPAHQSVAAAMADGARCASAILSELSTPTT